MHLKRSGPGRLEYLLATYVANLMAPVDCSVVPHGIHVTSFYISALLWNVMVTGRIQQWRSSFFCGVFKDTPAFKNFEHAKNFWMNKFKLDVEQEKWDLWKNCVWVEGRFQVNMAAWRITGTCRGKIKEEELSSAQMESRRRTVVTDWRNRY